MKNVLLSLLLVAATTAFAANTSGAAGYQGSTVQKERAHKASAKKAHAKKATKHTKKSKKKAKKKAAQY